MQVKTSPADDERDAGGHQPQHEDLAHASPLLLHRAPLSVWQRPVAGRAAQAGPRVWLDEAGALCLGIAAHTARHLMITQARSLGVLRIVYAERHLVAGGLDRST